MLSCQQTQNVIDGKKRIILNPTEAQRRDMDTVLFSEDEVYGIDILVSSGEDGKVGIVFSLGLLLFSFFLTAVLLGPRGSLEDKHLPERQFRNVSIKIKEFPHRVLGNAKKGRGFPSQHPCHGG